MAASVLIRVANQLQSREERDGDCLRRFAENRNEAAFAELVRRHGPAVFGILRRALGDHQLAEDAFQAVFVILARRASTIRSPDAVGGWLFGVARHVAARAVTMRKRQRKEARSDSLPDRPMAPVEPDDTSAIVEAEIARLPESLRAAVVLCEIEGVSRAKAARQLGIAEGTLSSRLASARKKLAERLRQRGLALGAVLGTVSAVPTNLSAAAARTATDMTTLTPTVAKLTGEALHMILFSKLKVAAVAVACLMVAMGGVGNWRSTESTAAPVPKEEKDEGLIWVYNGKSGELTAYTPEGKTERELSFKAGGNFIGFSRGGEMVLFLAKKGQLTDADDGDGRTLHIAKPSDLTAAIDTGIAYRTNDSFLLTHDKKRIVRVELTQIGQVAPAKPVLYRHTLIDLATKKETPIELPESVQLMEEAFNGEEWIGMDYNLGRDPKLPGYRYLRLPMKGGKLVPICDDYHLPFLHATPDGQAYLGMGNPFPFPCELKGWSLYRINPASGKVVELEQFDDLDQRNLRWSPDGKRYLVKKHGDTDVFVTDSDGKNRKKLFALPNAGLETHVVGWFPIKPKAAAADPRKRNAPVPKAAPPEGVILVSGFSHKEPDKLVEVLEAAGKSQGYLKLGGLDNVRQTRVSPDGKRLAFIRFVPLRGADPKGKYAYPEDLYIVDLPLAEPPTEPVRKGLIDPSIAWAADGKSLFVSSIPKETDTAQEAIKDKIIPVKTVRFDPATKTEKAFDLPEGLAVQDVSPDGKTLLARIKSKGTDTNSFSSFLVPLDTLNPERIGDEDDGFASARFSPDGTRIAGIREKYSKSKVLGLFTLDVAKGKIRAVPLPKEIAEDSLNSLAWAPDSKRLALLWQGATGGLGIPGTGGVGADGGATSQRITVLDADGGHAKTIREYAPRDWHYQVEWADPKLSGVGKPAVPDPRKRNAPVRKAAPLKG